ncbi:MAG TPA: patatin-like phospholipase family protein [Mycobacteriales bacterium]|nr:patatin-like phospholipase family protein [Mycobacteriales bacterium]
MTVLPLWRRGRRDAAPASEPAREIREAVVFSGGGSLAAAQVGALQALFESGIVPDAVVGCSAGALNAAFIAAGPTIERVRELEQVWRGITRELIFPDGRFSVARRLASRTDHLYSPEGLRGLIADCVPVVDLAHTEIPCHVVTTDLLAGEPVWWTAGDPVEVLAASACLPGLFPPVTLAGSQHVDGGVSCPVPAQRAVDLGAARVWVLDVAQDFHGWVGEGMTALDVLLESFAISRSHLGRRSPVVTPGQRVVTLPPMRLGRHDLRDFSRTSSLLAAGREAGRAMIAAELATAPRQGASAAG